MENKNDLNHGGDVNGTNEFSEFDFDEDFFEETQDRRRKSKLRHWHERSTLFSLVQKDAEERKSEDIFNIPTSTIGEASRVNEIQFGQHLDEGRKTNFRTW